jgi:hypothetical protein
MDKGAFSSWCSWKREATIKKRRQTEEGFSYIRDAHADDI